MLAVAHYAYMAIVLDKYICFPFLFIGLELCDEAGNAGKVKHIL